MKRRMSKSTASLAERLALHSRDDESGCRLWIGAKDPKGYGKILWNGKLIGAHRASWMANRGAIPAGLCVLHDCPSGDNEACINPNHLWLGTYADNNADTAAKGRQAYGERNGMSKLTWAKVALIRSDERPAPVIAAEFGVNPTYIYEIIKGRAWKFPPCE